ARGSCSMTEERLLTSDQISDLTNRLHSRTGWGRRRAVVELLSADFEQFERPPQFELLVAALHTAALQARARQSLTHILGRLGKEDGPRLGIRERNILRSSLVRTPPHQYADFL